MNKILVLIGQSGVGKTSVREKLVSDYGYNAIITYTTRPMRAGEKQGLTYNFVTQEQFDKLTFAETASYIVHSGNIWWYGTLKKDLVNSINKKVIIVNPFGLKNIIKAVGKDNLYIVGLTVDEDTRWKRLVERGDNQDEIKRRMLQDSVDFTKDIYKLMDAVIENKNDTIDNIAKIIDRAYKMVNFNE